MVWGAVQGLSCCISVHGNSVFSSVSLLDFNIPAYIYSQMALQIKLIDIRVTAKTNYPQIALSMPVLMDKCFYRLIWEG